MCCTCLVLGVPEIATYSALRSRNLTLPTCRFPTASAPLRVRETINSNVMLVDKYQVNNGIISFLLFQFLMRLSSARTGGILSQLWGSLGELTHRLAVLGSKMFCPWNTAQKSLESSLKGKLGTPKAMANEVREGSILWLGSHWQGFRKKTAMICRSEFLDFVDKGSPLYIIHLDCQKAF